MAKTRSASSGKKKEQVATTTATSPPVAKKKTIAKASKPSKKKVVAKKEEPIEKEPIEEEPTEEEPTETSIDLPKVVIEACKQWSSFKTRANKIVKAIGDKAVVEINKEKPGKGNFVVRVEGVEEPIVELLEMKRPFKPLKDLDLDDVSKDVLAALEQKASS